jgi:hypothetical protein
MRFSQTCKWTPMMDMHGCTASRGLSAQPGSQHCGLASTVMHSHEAGVDDAWAMLAYPAGTHLASLASQVLTTNHLENSMVPSDRRIQREASLSDVDANPISRSNECSSEFHLIKSTEVMWVVILYFQGHCPACTVEYWSSDTDCTGNALLTLSFHKKRLSSSFTGSKGMCMPQSTRRGILLLSGKLAFNMRSLSSVYLVCAVAGTSRMVFCVLAHTNEKETTTCPNVDACAVCTLLPGPLP